MVKKKNDPKRKNKIEKKETKSHEPNDEENNEWTIHTVKLISCYVSVEFYIGCRRPHRGLYTHTTSSSFFFLFFLLLLLSNYVNWMKNFADAMFEMKTVNVAVSERMSIATEILFRTKFSYLRSNYDVIMITIDQFTSDFRYRNFIQSDRSNGIEWGVFSVNNR